MATTTEGAAAAADTLDQTPKTHNKTKEPVAPPRNLKRQLSPQNEEENQKKYKNLSTDEINELACKEVGMDYQKDDSAASIEVDKREMEEVMLTRMNECMKDIPTFQTEEQGTSVSVNNFFQKMIPELMKTILGVAIQQMDKTMNRWLEKVDKKVEAETSAMQHKYQDTCLKLKFENDALQQYTRRESVKIFGIAEKTDETAEQVESEAIKVFSDAGLTVRPEDMHAVHRNGPRQRARQGPRPILVKFISRRTKRDVMKQKKTLKDKEGYDNIYIHEDLTPLRSKMVKYIKDHKEDLGLNSVWTVEGKIYTQAKFPRGLPFKDRPRPIVLEDPGDIFKIGVDRIPFADLDLKDFLFVSDI